MGESRRKSGKDFGEGAVRLVRGTGKPIALIARDLGINEGTLGDLGQCRPAPCQGLISLHSGWNRGRWH